MSGLRRALHRAREAVTLNSEEAATLLLARGEDLDALLEIAGRVRDSGLEQVGRPGVITYSRKVFVPLTRLCRDRCHYCTFATTPKRLPSPYLSMDEALDIARQGAAQGCKEALITLGDAPEDRWPAAQEWLDANGYDSTLAYVRAVAIRILEETGLLPHLNPGVLGWEDLQRLKPVAPSMGMMLETTATRLFSEPGGCHYGSPDKDPAVRLRVLEDAGRSSVPFTTGVLIGIGETLVERVDAIFTIREVARRYGGIQEVIVQNFRAKPDTAMAREQDATLDDLAATVAVARILLGPAVRIQAPPNLIDDEFALLLRAGIDDWGGVSPVTVDHVNPERPWPHLDELAARTRDAGFELRERLTIYPEMLGRGEAWLDPRLRAHVDALRDEQGLADETALPLGRSWQEPDIEWSSSGRIDLHRTVDTEGRTHDRRDDFDEVYGDWAAIPDASTQSFARLEGDVAAALRSATRDPAGLSDDEAMVLFHADGAGLRALCDMADDVRRDVVGDEVTYVVNRNINFTNVCYTGCRFCAFAQRRTDADAFTLSLDEVGRRAEEAWAVGATEICMQGGIHPELPGTAYFELAREIKRRVPDIHLHAYSPMEILNGSARTGLSFREFLIAAKEAGVDSIPGTAAEILDDEVRWVLTKGKLPSEAWIDIISTAHEVGLRSSSTMMYGHVDEPRHWLAHLRTLAGIQDRTGGFTEFVGLPFVHQSAPLYLAGKARAGATEQENRAVHAMARLLLHGRIDNIQTSWVKLGDHGTRLMLTGGANDVGGTLMEETISRMAGADNGSLKTVAELRALATAIGRPARQRSTTYGPVDDERQRAGDSFDQTVRRYLPLAQEDRTASTCQ
ncbi:MAG: bifunctional FO biosynthesis protein CofGH [Nocardioides sp.]|uniref:bifunctional FO biosynthesis protein CofGH n=1 Tax=Nocardioides sp. TaxID=35761 RepID=UPI0032663149